MSAAWLWRGVLLAGIAFILCTLLLLRALKRQDRLAARIEAIRSGAQPGRKLAVGAADRPVLGAVAALGTSILRTGLLSARTIEQLQQTLASAGFRGTSGLAAFIGAKITLLFGLPLLTALLLNGIAMRPSARLMAIAGMAVIGLLAPDFILRSMRKRYVQRVERGLADALDMLVICAEAGLSLEPAIGRVGLEIRQAHPAVAEELTQTANELRIISDSRIALTNMGTRTGLDGLKRLGSTLIQTLQYGTPLTQALRVLSAEMRQETLTRFEARAARLPVLLTMPMIVFILPCLFMIVGGPAMIHVLHAMHHQ